VKNAVLVGPPASEGRNFGKPLNKPLRLLVDGDPIADINLIEDPEKNLLVIMKDGRIYKNALRQ
jgi:hypothetical protein